jgi:hypothetical protein
MPRQLKFDKRRKAWVEEPKTWLEELNERSDDFHAGLIVGVGVGGTLFSIIMALAAVVNLL